MKMPSHCPFCQEPLLNEFRETRNGDTFLRKTCFRKPDHKVTYVSRCDECEIELMGIELHAQDMLRANWNFISKELFVTRGPPEIATSQPMPYFEPKLDDYKKLVEKIKTYLPFS